MANFSSPQSVCENYDLCPYPTAMEAGKQNIAMQSWEKEKSKFQWAISNFFHNL